MSNWHKVETDLGAESFSTDFWSQHKDDLKNGEFWADRIKKLRGEPVKRLSLALENMPLPASFKEASIAIRALIRDKRKLKEEYEEELALLYWLAAINSFSIPYSKTLQEPGYNVIESIPGNKLKSLPFSYKSLGYEKLELLNKTDIKWLIAQWGEPNTHSTLHEIHNPIWCGYEEKLLVKRNQSSQEFSRIINEPKVIKKPKTVKEALPEPVNPPSNRLSTKFAIISLVVVIVAVIMFVG